MNRKIVASSLLTIIATISLSSLTTVNAEERKGPRRGKPPTEAFEACANMSADDSCSFTPPHGEVTGTCKVPPRGDEELVCAPKGGRPPKQD